MSSEIEVPESLEKTESLEVPKVLEETTRETELRFLRACQKGKTDVIDELIGKVNINCTDSDGETGLMIACCKKAPWVVDVITRLVQHGIDVDLRNHFVVSPMERICYALPFQPDVAAIVLYSSSKGVNNIDENGYNYLVMCRSIESITFLVNNGININYTYNDKTYLDRCLPEFRSLVQSLGGKKHCDL